MRVGNFDSNGITTSMPNAMQNGVWPVECLGVERYTHRTLGNSSAHLPRLEVSRHFIRSPVDRKGGVEEPNFIVRDDGVGDAEPGHNVFPNKTPHVGFYDRYERFSFNSTHLEN